MEFKHKPVLLQECIENLKINPDGIYVDGTLGGAGHSIEIAKRLSQKGLLIGIDRDEEALKAAKDRLKGYENVKYVHGNHDEICESRKNKIISTTGELVKIIENAVPGYAKKEGHPAKRTFQAIRIEVNNEIEPLYNTVKNSIDVLKPKGRLCIITFHSLEDRAVKNAYQVAKGKCICPKDLPYCICGKKSQGEIITRKPIIPTEEEQKNNSRAKSAKLRVFEKN